MPNRVFFSLIVLLSVSGVASAQKHRGHRATLRLPVADAASSNHGATVDFETGATVAVPALLKLTPDFVEFHSARVQNDLLLFQPSLIGITPAIRSGNTARLTGPPPKKELHFFAPAKAADDLEVRRDRDKLLLFRGPQPQGAAVGLGVAMFGATTLLAAHAPKPVRFLFDGPVHLGPAIFDGGGMGAGIGGRAR
jgi:hypothetical protein